METRHRTFESRLIDRLQRAAFRQYLSRPERVSELTRLIPGLDEAAALALIEELKLARLGFDPGVVSALTGHPQPEVRASAIRALGA